MSWRPLYAVAMSLVLELSKGFGFFLLVLSGAALLCTLMAGEPLFSMAFGMIAVPWFLVLGLLGWAYGGGLRDLLGLARPVGFALLAVVAFSLLLKVVVYQGTIFIFCVALLGFLSVTGLVIFACLSAVYLAAGGLRLFRMLR